MAKFVYRERSTESLQRRATASGNEFPSFILDDFKVYTPKKGANWIRILPPQWEGAEHYGLDVYVHYQVGPEKASVLCLNKMRAADYGYQYGTRCPICEARVAAERAGEEKEAVRALGWRQRVLVWMLDRNAEQEGPQLWPIPKSVDKDIAIHSQDRQTGEYYVADHPDEGYDITFDREGEGVGTKYPGVNLTRKPTSVEQVDLDWVADYPVPDTLLWRSYEEILDLFSGGVAPEEVARPAPRRPGPAPQRGAEAPRGRALAARDEYTDQRPAARTAAPQRRPTAPDREETVAPRERYAPPTRRAAAEPEFDEPVRRGPPPARAGGPAARGPLPARGGPPARRTREPDPEPEPTYDQQYEEEYSPDPEYPEEPAPRGAVRGGPPSRTAPVRTAPPPTNRAAVRGEQLRDRFSNR